MKQLTKKYFNVDHRKPWKVSLGKLPSWKLRFSVSLTENDGNQTKLKLEQGKRNGKENHRDVLWIDLLLLETWKTRKSLGMCYCHKTSCSTEIGLLRFSASVRKRQDGNLSWKWSTSELVGKVRNNPSQIRNFVRKLVLPYPTRNKPTPSNIHVFRGLQCLTACSSCFNVVVTQLLIHPWPLKSSKRHPIPLSSVDAVLSPCAMAVVISPQVFSTTAEVAIFEFSANTTVSSVRNLFFLSRNTCNVSKTSFAANKSSKSTR